MLLFKLILLLLQILMHVIICLHEVPNFVNQNDVT